jgi:outer membrane lipoprotein SlyB
VPWAICALCVAILLAGGAGTHAAAACGAVSGALLGLVDASEPRIGRALARVLADVALMTPAVPILGRLLA